MRVRRRTNERGASLVEFALVAPLLFMILFGVITGGLALSHKLDLSTATREAARYGATLPDNEFGTNGAKWASQVAQQAVSQSGGALNVSGAHICVALVNGSAGTPYSPSGGTPYYFSADYPYTASSGSPGSCFNDSGADNQPRVQVKVQRPDSLQAIFFTKSLTLTVQADAQFESGL